MFVAEIHSPGINKSTFTKINKKILKSNFLEITFSVSSQKIPILTRFLFLLFTKPLCVQINKFEKRSESFLPGVKSRFLKVNEETFVVSSHWVWKCLERFL